MFSKIRIGMIWTLVSSDQSMRLDSMSAFALIFNAQSSSLSYCFSIYLCQDCRCSKYHGCFKL